MLISKILQMLKDRGSKEPTAPGLMLSSLPNGQYYVAIHRFRERIGNGRIIVCSSKNADFDVALQNVIDLLPASWDASIPVTLVQ